jgi:hypothetical protein
MNKPTWTRWAILGSTGLYEGQTLTRRDAIEQHVARECGIYRYKPNIHGKALWKQRCAYGDRAVKIRITLA